MLKRSLVLLPLCVVLVSGTAFSGDKKDQDNLQGTWSVVKFSGGKGKEDPSKYKITFKGNKMSISKVGDKVIDATFTLDASKKPKTIDLTMEGGGEKHTVLAIYELKGDTLRVSHFEAEKGSKSRPENFTGNDETVVAELKRDKK